MSTPIVEVLESAEETQRTFGDEEVRLRKARVRIDGRLMVVRKEPLRGAPLGDVVLVHGFAQNRYSWHSSSRSMSAWLVKRGYRTHSVEMRGHGLSRAGPAPERFSDYVDDAVRLAEAIDVPAFWIGHSLGGAVSYAAATRTPMRGVVGIGALFRFAQANRSLNALCRISNLLKGRQVLGGLSVRTRLAGQLLGRLYGISDIAGYAFPISGWAPGSIEPEILAERLERGFDWTSLHVWLDMARWGATGEFEYEEAWRATQVPVLVISGDLDHLMPPEDARVAFDLAHGPDKTLLPLDPWTTGLHWGHLDLILGKDAPRWVWAPIGAWLEAR
jgi:polyhydroxyalkanoate synthase subunit PhaC